jgi:ABC-type transport system involved in multi-copper enzyme maturation permease subunit
MSTGQIHDLGYKRYVGTRRSFGTRWLVIMRHQVATTWKGWWRFKLWFICGLLATAVSGGILYFASGKMFRALGGLANQSIRFADGILPLSMTWYCPIGFFVGTIVCSTVVAGDIQSGAFTFYFARSVRPRDYVLGKLAGLALLLSFIMLLGPFVLSLIRLGLSDNLDDLIHVLPNLPKALAVGLLGTLVYAAVPLGFSAVIANKRYAMALWAIYYVVLGSMAEGISSVTKAEIGAIDLSLSLKSISFQLFDVRILGNRGATVPMGFALLSIFVHAALAIGLVLWRVRKAQQSGVGGAS